jgi:hypothetical protein
MDDQTQFSGPAFDAQMERARGIAEQAVAMIVKFDEYEPGTAFAAWIDLIYFLTAVGWQPKQLVKDAVFHARRALAELEEETAEEMEACGG